MEKYEVIAICHALSEQKTYPGNLPVMEID